MSILLWIVLIALLVGPADFRHPPKNRKMECPAKSACARNGCCVAYVVNR